MPSGYSIVMETGTIYGVINNAGIGLRGYFEDLDDVEIRRSDANVFGVMSVTRAVLPHMRKAGRGRILLISSVGGRIGSLGVSTYCSSKFALEGFGESLFMGLSPLGIQVSLIEPGIIKTERWTVNRGTGARATRPAKPLLRVVHEIRTGGRETRAGFDGNACGRGGCCTSRATAEHPKLRYMIGRKAKLAVALRRWLPGDLFERIYFGIVVRRATQGEKIAAPRAAGS